MLHRDDPTNLLLSDGYRSPDPYNVQSLVSRHGKWTFVPRGRRLGLGGRGYSGNDTIPLLTGQALEEALEASVILPSMYARDRAGRIIESDYVKEHSVETTSMLTQEQLEVPPSSPVAAPTSRLPLSDVPHSQPAQNEHDDPITASITVLPPEIMLHILSYVVHTHRVYHFAPTTTSPPARMGAARTKPQPALSVHMVVPARQTPRLSASGTGYSSPARTAAVCKLWRTLTYKLLYSANVFIWELSPFAEDTQRRGLNTCMRLPEGARSYNWILPFASLPPTRAVLWPLTPRTAACATDIRHCFPFDDEASDETFARNKVADFLALFAAPAASQLKRFEVDLTPVDTRTDIRRGCIQFAPRSTNHSISVISGRAGAALDVRLAADRPSAEVEDRAVAEKVAAMRGLLGGLEGVQTAVLCAVPLGDETVSAR